MGSNCGKPDQQRKGQETASAGEGGGVSEECVCGELRLAFYAISDAMVLNL